MYGMAAKAIMIHGGAPDREHRWAIIHANECKQYAPTRANSKARSPMAVWEGVDVVKTPSRLLRAPLYCRINVFIHGLARLKYGDASYAALFLGISIMHGGFIVRSLHDYKARHASSMHVLPYNFSYRLRLLKQPTQPREQPIAEQPIVGEGGRRWVIPEGSESEQTSRRRSSTRAQRRPSRDTKQATKREGPRKHGKLQAARRGERRARSANTQDTC